MVEARLGEPAGIRVEGNSSLQIVHIREGLEIWMVGRASMEDLAIGEGPQMGMGKERGGLTWQRGDG